MLFSEFSRFLQDLENNSSRLKITDLLRELIAKIEDDEIDRALYLSLGILGPNYEAKIINLAEKMMIRAIALAFGVEQSFVLSKYREFGDLGEVSEHLSSKPETKLTIGEVYEKLLDIANDGGEGSQERKIQHIAELMLSLDSLSTKYLTRIPLGKLRLGFSEKTIIDALSQGNNNKLSEIEAVYNIRPDIGFIAKLVKTNKLKEVRPEIGIPVVPMLAQRLNSTSEMIKKMIKVAVEPKYDGLRIFIHYKKLSSGEEKIYIFTRNMNAIPLETFPELKEIGKYLNANSAIIDTEAVGVDFERKSFLDFQTTIQRRRKHQVADIKGSIPLQFQAFDILYLDGRSLINETYLSRREILEKVVKNSNIIKIDETTITDDPIVINTKHLEYINKGLEGVVVKKADSGYVSGRAGWNWVKMKESEGKIGRLPDTLDCIVMGYFFGKGKRAKFGIGKILVGIKYGDNILTLTKVGTGLTEDALVDIKSRIDGLKSDIKPKEYVAQKDLIPDVWAYPNIVVEIAADSLSRSVKHSLGLSLRFPRFIRYRFDKSAKEATALEELKEIYKMQS